MSVPLCIFAWLSLQAGAILLAALRIPLWAHAPAAGEFLAIPILLTIQCLGAALLMPRLVADWRSAVMAIAAAWPFATLAGLLAASPVSTTLYGGVYISGWIAVLWIWRLSLTTSWSQMVGMAIAAAWTAAGPVLLFIRSEYSPAVPSDIRPMARIVLGPLVNALSAADSSDSGRNPWPWIMLALAAGVGSGTMWGKRMLIAHFRSKCPNP